MSLIMRRNLMCAAEQSVPMIVFDMREVPAGQSIAFNVLTPVEGETFDVYWGDGTVDSELTSAPPAHIYENGGNYTIRLIGSFSEIGGSGTGRNTKNIFGLTASYYFDVPFDFYTVGQDRLQRTTGFIFLKCRQMTSVSFPVSLTKINGSVNAIYSCNNLTDVTFEGKTMAEVMAMDGYNWGIHSGATIHCTDGDIVV